MIWQFLVCLEMGRFRDENNLSRHLPKMVGNKLQLCYYATPFYNSPKIFALHSMLTATHCQSFCDRSFGSVLVQQENTGFWPHHGDLILEAKGSTLLCIQQISCPSCSRALKIQDSRLPSLSYSPPAHCGMFGGEVATNDWLKRNRWPIKGLLIPPTPPASTEETLHYKPGTFSIKSAPRSLSRELQGSKMRIIGHN